MLLRSEDLGDGFDAFLSIDAANDMPNLSSPFNRCGPIVDDDFVSSTRSPAGWVLPGLETLDEWIGRREEGTESLTLEACFLLFLGMLEWVVVFSTTCEVSRGMLIFCRQGVWTSF